MCLNLCCPPVTFPDSTCTTLCCPRVTSSTLCCPRVTCPRCSCPTNSLTILVSFFRKAFCFCDCHSFITRWLNGIEPSHHKNFTALITIKKSKLPFLFSNLLSLRYSKDTPTKQEGQTILHHLHTSSFCIALNTSTNAL